MHSVQQMTFKDLQRLVSQSQRESTGKELFQRLQEKPFWIWDKQQHKQKTFELPASAASTT